MKKALKEITLGMLASCLLAGGAAAQVQEIIGHNLNDMPDNRFGCISFGGGDRTPCNLWRRVYPDQDPADVQGVGGSPDGYPRYGQRNLRYLGDQQITFNFPVAKGQACEAWYTVWEGVVNPASPSFISYYGAASTIVNHGEEGNLNSVDCTPADGPLVACMGTLDSTTAVVASPGTPLGTIEPVGGMEPVPVPRIVGGEPSAVVIAWSAPGNENTVNLPSVIPQTCPVGSTFDDLTATSGPSPLTGVRLWATSRAEGDDGPTIIELEGGVLDADGALIDPLSNEIGGPCFDEATCPRSVVVACSGVGSGRCTPDGIDFLAVDQEITVEGSLLSGLLGMAGRGMASFNTKVVYAGATRTAASGAPMLRLNPQLVSLFSASSFPVAYEAVDPQQGKIELGEDLPLSESTAVTVSWTLEGPPVEMINLLRSRDDGFTFDDVATFDGADGPDFEHVDLFLGKRPDRVIYRVVVVQANGVVFSADRSYELLKNPGSEECPRIRIPIDRGGPMVEGRDPDPLSRRSRRPVTTPDR